MNHNVAVSPPKRRCATPRGWDVFTIWLPRTASSLLEMSFFCLLAASFQGSNFICVDIATKSDAARASHVYGTEYVYLAGTSTQRGLFFEWMESLRRNMQTCSINNAVLTSSHKWKLSSYEYYTIVQIL